MSIYVYVLEKRYINLRKRFRYAYMIKYRYKNRWINMEIYYLGCDNSNYQCGR